VSSAGTIQASTKRPTHGPTGPPSLFVTKTMFAEPDPEVRMVAFYKRPTGTDQESFLQAVFANEVMTRLEAIRAHRKLFKNQFATLLGIPRSSYSDFATGVRPPSMTLLVAAMQKFPEGTVWPARNEVRDWVKKANSMANNRGGNMPKLPNLKQLMALVDTEPSLPAPRSGTSQGWADSPVMTDPTVFDRILAIATDNLQAAAELLADGIPDEPVGTETGVVIEIDNGDADPVYRQFPHRFLTGYVCPDKTHVSVALDKDWLRHVDDTGLVAPGGVFILRFLETADGEPQRVLALRCLPSSVDGDDIGDWEPAASPATIMENSDGSVKVEWDDDDPRTAGLAYQRYFLTGDWDNES